MSRLVEPVHNPVIQPAIIRYWLQITHGSSVRQLADFLALNNFRSKPDNFASEKEL
jgi:hypothetical protein